MTHFRALFSSISKTSQRGTRSRTRKKYTSVDKRRQNPPHMKGDKVLNRQRHLSCIQCIQNLPIKLIKLFREKKLFVGSCPSCTLVLGQNTWQLAGLRYSVFARPVSRAMPNWVESMSCESCKFSDSSCQVAKSAVMAVDRAVDAKPQSVEAMTRAGCPAARA